MCLCVCVCLCVSVCDPDAQAARGELKNEKYNPSAFGDVVVPVTSLKRLSLWNEYFLRYDHTELHDDGLLLRRLSLSCLRSC